MRTRNKVLLVVVLAVVAIAAALYGWYRDEYPHGRTHQCSRMLIQALLMYSADHEDKFPSGGATPEASLCVLYREKYIDAGTLAGRAFPRETAERILESGGVLGPENCDWHYVEGINHDADVTIAVFWGKASLGHSGQNLHGGHEVAFNDSHVEVIPAERWKAFLAEQEELVAEYRRRKQEQIGPSPP